MEVASPLSFAPSGAGTKRGHAYSPQMLKTPNRGSLSEMEDEDESMQYSTKRRRFNNDTSVESLSEHFSSHSPFFAQSKKSIFASSTAAQSVKRPRTDAPSPVQQDLNRLVGEQASIIESLKKEKSTVESSLVSLKTDHEKISKENALFRRAVTIQQDRQNQAENQIKVAHQYRVGAEDQIKKMEQVILSLRYHLQAQQPSFGNDFMGNRPPDVF